MHCASAAAGIPDEQELQEMLVDGRTGGLNKIDVIAADAFLELNMQFAVRKPLDNPRRQLNTHLAGDVFRQLGIGRTR
jgi:hypothetical protein